MPLGEGGAKKPGSPFRWASEKILALGVRLWKIVDRGDGGTYLESKDGRKAREHGPQLLFLAVAFLFFTAQVRNYTRRRRQTTTWTLLFLEEFVYKKWTRDFWSCVGGFLNRKCFGRGFACKLVIFQVV